MLLVDDHRSGNIDGDLGVLNGHLLMWFLALVAGAVGHHICICVVDAWIVLKILVEGFHCLKLPDKMSFVAP